MTNSEVSGWIQRTPSNKEANIEEEEEEKKPTTESFIHLRQLHPVMGHKEN